MNPFILGAWFRARLHLGEHDQKGANLVEYILLIVFIALLVIVAVTRLKTGISNKFDAACGDLSGSACP